MTNELLITSVLLLPKFTEVQQGIIKLQFMTNPVGGQHCILHFASQYIDCTWLLGFCPFLRWNQINVIIFILEKVEFDSGGILAFQQHDSSLGDIFSGNTLVEVALCRKIYKSI